jgi:hypothetical protein
MSNIFITDVVGSNDYAVPADDTELATATAGLDAILSPVANLAYDRVLAWVEDSGGPAGAEGNRTLNCLIEKFTYNTDECPSEAEVNAMIAAIESALEADADITSVGNQQVHIFQAGAYFLWNRDASGGFLYPNVETDDVAVGPFASPNGKWFNDGDLVLGTDTMSGTEKLRVVGDVSVEGVLSVSDTAAIGTQSPVSTEVLYVRDNSETGASYGVNTYLAVTGSNTKINWYGYKAAIDHQSSQDMMNITGYEFGLRIESSGGVTGQVKCFDTGYPYGDFGGTIATFIGYNVGSFYYNLNLTTAYGLYISDLSVAGTSYGIYQAGSDDMNVFLGDVAVGSTSMFLNEKLYVLDTDETKYTRGMFVTLEKDDGGGKFAWDGLTVYANHTGDNGVSSDYVAIRSILTFDTASAQTLPAWVGFQNLTTVDTPSVVTLATGFAAGSPSGAGTITTSFGINVADQGLNSTTTYGIYVASQTGTTALGLYVDDDVEITGKLTVGGLIDPTGMVFDEQATVPGGAPGAGKGTLWVRNDTPNVLVFTDDAGTDWDLNTGSSSPWTVSSNVIYPSTLTDDVAIGASSMSGTEKLYVYQSASGTATGFVNVLSIADLNDANITGDVIGVASGWDCGLSGGGALSGYYAAFEALQDSGTASGTGIEAYGFRCRGLGSSGSVDKAYGVYIHAQFANSTGYGIYQEGDGDINIFNGTTVIGDYLLSGTDLLQVAGNVNIRANGKLTISDSATIPPLNITERSTAPSAPVGGDIYLDDGSNTASGDPGWRRYDALSTAWEDISAGGGGGSSLWTQGVGFAYLTTTTDDVAIGASSMSGTERLYVNNTATTGSIITGFFFSDLNDQSIGKLQGVVSGWSAGAGGGGALSEYYAAFEALQDSGTASGIGVEAYGFRCRELGSSGSVGTAYGVYIHAQNANTAGWGIYQEGQSDNNYFAGDVGIGNSTIGSRKLYVYHSELDNLQYGLDVELQQADTTTSTIHRLIQSTLNYRANQNASITMFRSTATIDTTSGGYTLSLNGYESVIETADGDSYSNIRQFYANISELGGDVENYYAFYAEATSPTDDINNSYGIYIKRMYGTTNSYGIYQESADDDNYFAGNVGINILSPTTYLDIQDREQTVAGSGARVFFDKATTSTKASFNGVVVEIDGSAAGTITTAQGFVVNTTLETLSGSAITNLVSYRSILTPAGGTVSDYRGFYVTGSTIGTITNSYGVYIGEMAGDTASYGVYQSSETDLNYFSGFLGIGTLPSSTIGLSIQENSKSGSPTGIQLVQGYTSSNMTDPKGFYVNSDSSVSVTSYYGVLVDYKISGGTTSTVVGVASDIGATSGTITSLTNFYARPATQGGVISTSYGLRIGDIGDSGATVYGVHIDGLTGTNTYGIYQIGSSDVNYFNGQVGIGTSSPSTSAALEISSTTRALIVSRMTTTQRDALTAVAGMIIFNTTTGNFEGCIVGGGNPIWTIL